MLMHVDPIAVFAAGFTLGAIGWATLGEWVVRSIARYLVTH